MAKRKWGEWTEHYNAKKKKYYYFNAKTKESTYTMPKGFNDHAKKEEPPAKKKRVASTAVTGVSASDSTWQQGFSKSKVYNLHCYPCIIVA